MSGEPPRDIPPALYEELLKLRPLLEGLCCRFTIRHHRDDDVYTLRIRVPDDDCGRIKRRITVADENVAVAAQAMIDGWRQERAAKEAEERERTEAEQECKRKLRELRRAVVAGAGGSSRRRRAAREFDATSKDPAALCVFLIAGPQILPDRRPGPKPAGSLS